MRQFRRFSCILAFLVFCINIMAQSAGDRLFSEGQQYQMVQTVKSQNLAIKKFSAAKKAYDSTAKKTMCDNQITICQNNIKTLNKKVKVYTKEVVVEDKKESDSVAAVLESQEPVKLSLSVSSLEFKSSGKKKDNHQVTVECNYDDWTFSQPEWINITQNGNILTLTAAPNETNNERSGILLVECRGSKAELMIYQKNKFSLKSLIGGK